MAANFPNSTRPMHASTSSKGALFGDLTLAVAAFSSPTERQRMECALIELTRLGVSTRTVLDPSAAYGRDEFLFASDSPENRAKALHDLATDPSVGVIMAARGGSGAMEMLPLLDWKLLAKHPKPLIGFSDSTALLVTLLNRAGWPTMHGPSLEGAFAQAENSVAHRTSGEKAISYLRGSSEALEGVRVKRLCGAGDAVGPIIGGNLSTLTSLVGAPWQPNVRGGILFLEEVGERPYRIQRMLMQLKHAGVLDGLTGVLLGNFSQCEHPTGAGPSAETVLKAELSGLNVPVFGYVESGHCPTNLVVPFGRTAKISESAIVFQ